MASLPSNVHVSTHPCVQAKLSQLRSASASSREVKSLIHEISTIVGVEALAKGLTTTSAGTDQNPLGYTFPVSTITPTRISLVPILRSGLGMIDALSSVLPNPVPVHHLGLYREKTTLQPVEYYNNLPYHKSTASNPTTSPGPSELAIVVDPVIATGATACSAIETLRDWGVKKVIVCAIIASEDGLIKAAETWPEGVEVFVGGCDKETDDKGMIKPGLGDVGDRLFLTIGK
ncbi:uracil phosphoribosyltransferase-domain-containing protein [Macrophomina phaseolina]|uniref:uracil phosphoribosyltransferase n=1 Tax=Macrophomina phaseolina TaxID=35725 RepID=A0ABQ8FYI8_9PEZI|nr:uracil phosphoribosyltransferase-domain-containing protein [Macrophomina phaseolina]